MNVCVVGLGLIGGSTALALKKSGLVKKIIGVESNLDHAKEAVKLKIVEEIFPLSEAIVKSDFVILAVPVDVSKRLIGEILDYLPLGSTVMDMGSTKLGISKACENHPKRSQFVAVHPIAGTENTGPSAAFDSLFYQKTVIICDKELSAKKSLSKTIDVLKLMNMNITYMSSKEHDKHIAYVSHLSHISSFALGLTVLDIEKDEKNIFNMAGSGFESTVRLAKSSPEMWEPILLENSKNLLEALEAYIDRLNNFKESLIDLNGADLKGLMEKANTIRKILKK